MKFIELFCLKEKLWRKRHSGGNPEYPTTADPGTWQLPVYLGCLLVLLQRQEACLSIAEENVWLFSWVPELKSLMNDSALSMRKGNWRARRGCPQRNHMFMNFWAEEEGTGRSRRPRRGWDGWDGFVMTVAELWNTQECWTPRWDDWSVSLCAINLKTEAKTVWGQWLHYKSVQGIEIPPGWCESEHQSCSEVKCGHLMKSWELGYDRHQSRVFMEGRCIHWNKMYFNVSKYKIIPLIQAKNDEFVARAGDGFTFPNNFAKHLSRPRPQAQCPDLVIKS